MKQFLTRQVAFLDTMADCITSKQQGSSGMVLCREPVPCKTLVILDTNHDLPECMYTLSASLGVVIRSTPRQLDTSQTTSWQWNLSSYSHAMTLLKLRQMVVLSSSNEADLYYAVLAFAFSACYTKWSIVALAA